MKPIQFLTSSFKIQNSKLLITHSTFLILLTTSLFSESYREHRVDDLNYANQGRKTIANQGRIETSAEKKKQTKTNENPNHSESELLLSSYLTPKFYSQRGGDKEDLAGRYANQINFSPELVGFKKTDNTKYMLLLAPIVSYRENFQLKRNVNRPVDTELIAAWKLAKKEFNVNLEGGRGFQRLDAYGLLFAGMANYVETNLYWKSFDATLSFLALSYNFNQKNLSLRDNDTNDKLMGGNLLFRSIPFLSQIQIFNYLVLEKGQIAEKQFLQEDKQFKPQGKFSYKGFELKTIPFFRITNMELGLFSVNGYRDYGEYAYQKFNSITKTNAYLTYLAINLEFGKWKFRTGGLYASKDKSSSLNKAHNGYSPLLSDVRIFGGKSSFLLMENVNERNGTMFKDFDSTKENSYNTKGMELASIGASYSVNQNFQVTGILNHTNSNLGIGNEGIISAMYQFSSRQEDNSSFLFASICAARVNPITQKKILYDEFRVDPSIKEFIRFYFSGGLYF
ncbi:MAG TPA: hypothetical protein PLX69_07240 [Leptospiraceae bacterium]|nr:hypothetical protein [Leptospiraceae bacterium]HRG74333.1 hypothetical protein [Leptospiraceae bacterium]